ncbi:Rne/Rng family ribonuclease [Calothrix sp. CCY 0018]|uniref:Rne/Rng family ribonuclease n=1 Tax=Calothrix sp. CCY 0018 TaxID=3103864 RepID=UPI0039C65B39
MPKQIIIAEQHQIAAVFSEDQIQELVVATGHHQIGDIYLGVVENVLPGIDAAFVNIGDPERNGFIHVTDLGPLRLRRSSAAITELLTPQQKVLVQVMKEPTGTKGPRLTGNITSPGRYVVLMPYGRGVNLSRRIRNENERNRLRALAILIKPAGMGLLIRTEAEGKPEEAIIEDLEILQKQWESIGEQAQTSRAPALLNRDDDFIQRVLRDMYGADVNRIVVDSSTGLKRVKQYLQNWSGGQVPQGLLIDHHRDRTAILEYFRINAAVKEALKPRVDLPSGGYIIIQPTEALTVIDVNSGSFTRSATARETVLWTNCEAATEIARQLRLRNIAGVIVVDFIDMESRRDQLQVLENFNKALKSDKARPQIAQLTELGLVELTRKRQGQNIYELFGETCPTCGGLGHIVHLPGENESRVAPPAAEIAERVVPLPQREPRLSAPRLSEPREAVDGFADADEGDGDFTNLNLINHPSYQELGDPNKRRRRRRINTGNGKDEPRINGSPLTLANDDLDADADAEPELRRSETPLGLNKGWSERPTERTSRTRVESVKGVLEPPEIVSVEMTQEEQDVYALMGVTPLKKLERDFKNEKSVIINVVPPGEDEDEDEDENEDGISESESYSLTPTPKKVKINNVDNEVRIEEQIEELEVLEEVEQPKQVEQVESNQVIDNSETETTTSDRRRRRRRSSVEAPSS